MPEYFLMPLESMPRSIGDIRQLSENIGSDPVVPRGYGAVYNETAYPFYPGPRPALRAGQTASWFFGEALEPDSATLLLGHAPSQGTMVRFGALTADGSTRWGAFVPVAAGSDRVTGPLPSVVAVGLSVQDGRLLALAACRGERGRPSLRAGGFACPPQLVPGPVASGRFVRRATPSSRCRSLPCRSRPSPPRDAASPSTSSPARRSPSRSASSRPRTHVSSAPSPGTRGGPAACRSTGDRTARWP